MQQQWEKLCDRLRPLVQKEEKPSELVGDLKGLLHGETSADIALAMEHFEPEEAVAVFDALDDAQASAVLAKLAPELSGQVAQHLPPDRFTRLVAPLSTRDTAEIVTEAPPDHIEAYLTDVADRKPSEAEEVEERLTYAKGTAGNLMTQDFVRLRPDMTAEEAVAAVRRTDPAIDIPDDLYVIEEQADNDEVRVKLVGVVSIRALMMAQADQRISQVMATEVVSVPADASQEAAAYLMSKYDFMALPILDAEGFLAGVIPMDDLLHVLVGRLNQQYAAAIGTDTEEMKHRNPLQAAQLRIPWLLGTMFIELGAGVVISRFDGVLKQVILLASFMPVISAISGNVGLQAAAIMVRALDSGQMSSQERRAAVWKEAATTFLMALVCGLTLGGIGALWSKHLPFGLIIGGALTCSMLTAGCLGTVVPTVSKRLGFDPATTAGPFETAFQDVIGFAVFLWLASLLLPWLK